MINSCPICGHSQFIVNKILWKDLVEQWQLAQYEVDYVNRQQGLCCLKCGNNLRSMALANAIRNTYGFYGTLIDLMKDSKFKNLKILEINEAGGLTSFLRGLPNHNLVGYPEYDMTCLRLNSSVYDVVIHSDTLEHVKNPISGLTECRRVLKKDGFCFFTVPTVVDRLTRSRDGLCHSYHGSPMESDKGLIVHTEYGADMWKHALLAGFSSVTIHSLEYPSGLALVAH